MTNINLLKPDNKNLPLFLTLGGLFFAFGIFDFYLNNFLNINITSFLPRLINFFIPLIFAVMDFILLELNFQV
jgi:general L-amino acid transport system permease protein